MRTWISLALLFLLAACQSAQPVPVTPAETSSRPVLAKHYDPEAGGAFQVDLRSDDLSEYDLRGAAADLLFSDFSTQTKWPDAQWLPEGFDPQAMLELGKDPGLGVRSLHAQGVTGQGISIAIIDQALSPIDHVEFGERVRLYETIGNTGSYSMHGPAVASIAIGKTVGVAPEANLYFIAAEIPFSTQDDRMIRDFTFIAQAVRRVVEINRTLPDGEKIRVLSISIGWDEGEPGYADVVAAVEEAKQAGIFVVSSSLEETYAGFKFNGLGRNPYGDPNQIDSYEAGAFWGNALGDPKTLEILQGRILVPMDSRTYASYQGKEDYSWGRAGGWSWSIPYLAGLYALAAQVNSHVTPEAFWQAVTDTAIPFSVQVQGEDTPLGAIIQPVRVIERMQK